MNKMKIDEWRDNVEKIFAWDFVFCEGDTIGEKNKSLYSIISTLALHKNGEEPATVVTGRYGSSAIVVIVPFNVLKARYEQTDGGLMYIGTVKEDCGGNGYCTDFELYEDDRLNEEVLVVRKEVVNLVKLFNIPVFSS